ncbi:MAG: DsrE family protein [Actinomycetota bacterium]
MAGKMVIMCTHGPENPELSTVAFAMATAAMASDVEVVVGLQADGVRLGAKGVAQTVQADKFPPLGDLLAAFLEGGGRLLVCAPCAMARNIDTANGLVTPSTVVGAAAFVAECLAADRVLTY